MHHLASRTARTGARKAFYLLVKAASGTWLLVHFSATVFYVAPPNPVRLEYPKVIHAVVGAFFPQNWNLFAPNPFSRNETLLVSCHETSTSNDGWFDLSAPLWERLQSKRLSAYDRLGRPAATALRLVSGGSPEVQPWKESCAKGSEDACEMVEKLAKESSERGKEVLVRLASSFCKRVSLKTQASFAEVSMRVRSTLANPWSRRFAKDNEVEEIALGRYPIDENVMPSPLYEGTQ